MATTIYDVARHARVSVATVSRVVNGLKVRDDLTQRVTAAVGALGYTPSRAAQRMRAPTSHLWALIVPDFENNFFTRVARGLELVCRPRNTCVFIGNSDDDAEKERHYLDVALAGRVGGLVIAPSFDTTDLSKLTDAGIPVVIVDRALPDRRYDTILTDNAAGGRLAARHLEAEGRRHVACISGPLNPTSGGRLEGFLAYARSSRSMDVVATESGNNRLDGGRAAMARVLQSGTPFDAVFCTNNLMALGAMRALEDLAPERGREVGIAGFDLSDLPLLSEAHIASVDQDPREMGRLAGERILLLQQGQRSLGIVQELSPWLRTTEGTREFR